MATSISVGSHVVFRPTARRFPRPAPDGEVTFTVTDRWEEIEEGLRVVHDGFVEAGYMDAQGSGMRMIPHYLNPGTSFVVAWLDGEAVGVIAVIPDGPFGLPSDRSFREEIDALRAKGAPLFEASSMSVRRSARRHTRRIVAGLFAGALGVLGETPGYNVLLSVEPRQEEFYAGLIHARRVAADRPLYGAPATLLVMDGPSMIDAILTPGSTGARLIRDMVLRPDSGWKDDHRCGERWPQEPVAALLAEQGCLSGLLGQLRVLDAVVPGMVPALA